MPFSFCFPRDSFFPSFQTSGRRTNERKILPQEAAGGPLSLMGKRVKAGGYRTRRRRPEGPSRDRRTHSARSGCWRGPGFGLAAPLMEGRNLVRAGFSRLPSSILTVCFGRRAHEEERLAPTQEPHGTQDRELPCRIFSAQPRSLDGMRIVRNVGQRKRRRRCGGGVGGGGVGGGGGTLADELAHPAGSPHANACPHPPSISFSTPGGGWWMPLGVVCARGAIHAGTSMTSPVPVHLVCAPLGFGEN